MKMLHLSVRQLSLLCAVFGLAVGCSRAADSRQDTTPPAQSAQAAPNPEAPAMVRGTVVSASPTELVIKSDSAFRSASISLSRF